MARPFFPWIGGKEKLIPYIHRIMPEQIAQYLEPFGGSGAVLLSLEPDPGRVDIYNDYNWDLPFSADLHPEARPRTRYPEISAIRRCCLVL